MLERRVETFCAVDDFGQTFWPQWEAYLLRHGRGPRGPKPALWVSAIFTLWLMLHGSGSNSSRIFILGPQATCGAAIFQQCRVMNGWWRSSQAC
jgi:hypothetical protein